jgi:hypothetical protein
MARRVLRILGWIVTYLLVAIIVMILLLLPAAIFIRSSPNSELGRAADGIVALYLVWLVSFFCISPAVIYGMVINLRRKQKIKPLSNSQPNGTRSDF